jgi:hypothetical protein
MVKKNINLYLFAALAAFCLFWGRSVAATGLFNDNFDNDTVGAVLGDLGAPWGAISGSSCTVTDVQSHSAANSIICPTTPGLAAQTVTLPASSSGAQDFWIYPTGNNYGDASEYNFFSGSTYQFGLSIRRYTNEYSVFVNTGYPVIYYGDIYSNNWYHVVVEWDGARVRISLDGGDNFSGWYDYFGGAGLASDNFAMIGAVNAYYDDFSGGVPPVVAGLYPIIEPDNPVSDDLTVVDLSSVVESGKVTIPTENTKVYTSLKIEYFRVNSFLPDYVDTITLPFLTSGQNYSYSGSANIPVQSSGGNYFRVKYEVTGVTSYQSSINNPPFSESVVLAVNLQNTWITDTPGGGVVPTGALNPAAWPDEPEQEDCDQYSGIDKVTCQLKNFAVSAIYPSRAALSQFSATLEAFKTKWPMSYLATIFGGFDQIRAGVDDATPRVIKFLSVSYTLNFDVMNEPIASGSAVTLGIALKAFFLAAIIGAFGAWAVNYMHRIKEV